MPFVRTSNVVDRRAGFPARARGQRGAVRPELLLCSLLGGVLGIASAIATYVLYPERNAAWAIPTLGAASMLLIVVLYAVSARRIGIRAGDSLFLGYLLTVLAGAALVIAEQVLGLVHQLAASNIGY